MSFVALLNSRACLDDLLRAGDRPAVIATWSSAVFEAAQAAGIPVLHEDDVISQAERVALHDRADDLTRALAGHAIPEGRHYNDWCWWALEMVFGFALSHAYRTQRLLAACETVAPGFRSVVHDREGYAQGAVTNFLAGLSDRHSFGFAPHTAERDTLHQRLDVFSMPEPKAQAQDIWQGKRLPKDPRPTVVMLHTNEVAHLVSHLSQVGQAWFCLAEDRLMGWPPNYIGPKVDARPAGPKSDVVAAVFPADIGMDTEPWERELLEALAMTWQASLREAYGWSRAAYQAGRVAALLGGGSIFPEVRARMLAIRDLGAKLVLVQHGMLHARHGGRGERVQHFADHQFCWSRTSVADISGWNAGGEFSVIGWPQSCTDRARAALAAAAVRPDAPPIGTEGPWVIVTSAPLPDEPYGWGETFLKDALASIRAVDPTGPIIIKHHPFQEPEQVIRELCLRWGHPDVEVIGGIDPWEVMKDARAVVAFKSTAVHCALQQRIPVVVYQPSEEDAMFERFAGFPLVRSPEALVAALRDSLRHADYRAAREYTRTDINAGRRAVAMLRRVLHGRPAARRARVSGRATVPAVSATDRGSSSSDAPRYWELSGGTSAG